MKKIAIIYFVFLSAFGQAKTLSAYVDFCRFKVNDSISFVEIYLGIDAPTVEFKEKTDGYQADILASIKLINDDKITYFEKFNIQSPFSPTSEPNFNKFNFSKRIATSNQNYKCELTIKDKNSPDSSFTIDFNINNEFKGNKILFSDIQLLSDYKKSDEQNDYTKSGFLMNPLTTNFFPNSMKSIKYYLEIYNTDTDEHLGADSSFVIFSTFRNKNGKLLNELGSYKRDKGKPAVGILNEIDITKLPSGNYFFIVEVRNKKNKLLSYSIKEIQRANTDFIEKEEAGDNLLSNNFTNGIEMSKIDYHLECLRPKASEAEMHTIRGLLANGDSTEKRNYFFNFWYKRYKNQAQTEYIKYARNIKNADNKFSCYGRPSYLNEQGRVYLKYGPPNRIETEFTDPSRNASTTQKEYQIWNYYNIAGGQSNRIFVFLRSNGGNCEYDLVHSTVNGELQNQDWIGNNNWRNMLKNNQGPTINNRTNDDEFSTEF